MRGTEQRRWYLSVLSGFYLVVLAGYFVHRVLEIVGGTAGIVPVWNQLLAIGAAVSAWVYLFMNPHRGRLGLLAVTALVLVSAAEQGVPGIGFHVAVLVLLLIPSVWPRVHSGAANAIWRNL